MASTVDFPFEKKPNFLRIGTPPDGSCLFYSVILGNILAIPTADFENRARVVKDLLDAYAAAQDRKDRKETALFKEGLALRETVGRDLLTIDSGAIVGSKSVFLKERARPETFAGHEELVFLPDIIKKQIHVYRLYQPDQKPTVLDGLTTRYTPIVRIVHVSANGGKRGNHYDVLVDLDTLNASQKNALFKVFHLLQKNKTVRFNTTVSMKIIHNNQDVARGDLQAMRIGAAEAQKNRNKRTIQQQQRKRNDAVTRTTKETNEIQRQLQVRRQQQRQKHRNDAVIRAKETSAFKRHQQETMGLPVMMMATVSTVTCTLSSFIAALSRG